MEETGSWIGLNNHCVSHFETNNIHLFFSAKKKNSQREHLIAAFDEKERNNCIKTCSGNLVCL